MNEKPEVIASPGDAGSIDVWDSSADEPKLTEQLVALLGVSLVALICAVETSLVESWSTGANPRPSAAMEMRLRLAHETAARMVDRMGRQTIRSWYVGRNAVLQRAPALAIREDAEEQAVWVAVTNAAASFLAE